MNFGRKSLGYLFAIQSGAEKIWDFETDVTGTIDYNLIIQDSMSVTVCDSFKSKCFDEHCIRYARANSRTVNPYLYFGKRETVLHPRGLLKKHAQESKFTTCSVKTVEGFEPYNVGLIQTISSTDPDIGQAHDPLTDFMKQIPGQKRIGFEMTYNYPSPLFMPSTSLTPFNKQATMWFKSAFMFSFLPISVPESISDIIRSYVANYFMPWMNKYVVFAARTPDAKSTVRINNDESNSNGQLLTVELEKELLRLTSYLETRATPNHNEFDGPIPMSFVNLYVNLYERHFINEVDLKLVFIWMKHFELYFLQAWYSVSKFTVDFK